MCSPLPFILSPPLSLSLQVSGYTALLAASDNGHAEAIKLLLTAPGIDVNHAYKVSPYLLIPLYLVRGKGGSVIYLTLSLHLPPSSLFPYLLPPPPFLVLYRVRRAAQPCWLQQRRVTPRRSSYC